MFISFYGKFIQDNSCQMFYNNRLSFIEDNYEDDSIVYFMVYSLTSPTDTWSMHVLDEY